MHGLESPVINDVQIEACVARSFVSQTSGLGEVENIRTKLRAFSTSPHLFRVFSRTKLAHLAKDTRSSARPKLRRM